MKASSRTKRCHQASAIPPRTTAPRGRGSPRLPTKRTRLRIAGILVDCSVRVLLKKIHFVSLGCPKNRVDTEVMVGVATGEKGFVLTDEAEDAEVIVVNTCGFIGEAKRESIETIFELAELKKVGACKKLVVTGCLSQRYPKDLETQMPEVDHFLGSSDMLTLGKVLDPKQKAERMLVGNPAEDRKSTRL